MCLESILGVVWQCRSGHLLCGVSAASVRSSPHLLAAIHSCLRRVRPPCATNARTGRLQAGNAVHARALQHTRTRACPRRRPQSNGPPSSPRRCLGPRCLGPPPCPLPQVASPVLCSAHPPGCSDAQPTATTAARHTNTRQQDCHVRAVGNCPTCNIALEGIRNRALERVRERRDRSPCLLALPPHTHTHTHTHTCLCVCVCVCV